MAPAIRTRPYKDFMTPALHTRFASAAAYLLIFCYVESLAFSNWNSVFWSWFPIGIAGIRALLFFIPAFFIFMLRLSQLHVGFRTSHSAWDTFKTYAVKPQVIRTVGWYAFSAWLFGEVYMWCASLDADLNRIKVIPNTERPTLNERPLYLQSYMCFVALGQALTHLYYDYDRLDLPTTKLTSGEENGQRTTLSSPSIKLRSELLPMIARSVKLSGALAITSPFIYSFDVGFGSIRRCAWAFQRSWAKWIWSLPKSGSLPSVRPFHYSVFLQTFAAGFMLLMLWEVGNTAFTVYVAQEPLKNERPITYESRDPNGSLLTGLTAKKLPQRAFAFWELVSISERFEGRRKMIFEDIDRKGGSTWSQILASCLEAITSIDKRLAIYEQPELPAASSDAQAETVSNLPRLTQPLKDGLHQSGDLFSQTVKPASKSKRAVEEVGNFARSHGQSPGSLSPKARRMLQTVESTVLTPEQKSRIDAQGWMGLFRGLALQLLQYPFAAPFRHQYRRTLAAVVLGSPIGDAGMIIDAVDALTEFSVRSLTEDKYGNVQRDVPLIIRTLTATITKLDNFQKNLGFHWTDVEKKRECPEVDVVMVALKAGLGRLISAFGDYSQDLRLSQSEMRMAREASTVPSQQMEKTK